MMYTISDTWLLLNGEKVLLCEGYSNEQMIELCEQYQKDADAPKIHIVEFPKKVPKEVYYEESDSLYFKEQRGEVPAGTWLAKIEEIRGRYK